MITGMLAACSTSSTQPVVHAFDPCAPLHLDAPEASDEQRAVMADASTLWRSAGISTRLGIAGDASIDVVFASSGAALHGLYDDGSTTIYLNRDLARSKLAIVFAHELGHAFGLAHVPIEERLSVMNPGNLTVPPSDDDRAAVEAIWGPCGTRASGVQ